MAKGQNSMQGLLRTAIPRANPVGGGRGQRPGGPGAGATKNPVAGSKPSPSAQWSGSAISSPGGIPTSPQPRDNGPQFLGDIPNASSGRPNRPGRIPNLGLGDMVGEMVGATLGGRPQERPHRPPAHIDNLLAEIERMTGRTYPPPQDAGNAFENLLASGREIVPYSRPVKGVPADMAEQLNGSLSDLLRRR